MSCELPQRGTTWGCEETQRPLDRFDLTLDGVNISIEGEGISYEAAVDLLLEAYPDKRVDIYKGLKKVIKGDTI